MENAYATHSNKLIGQYRVNYQCGRNYFFNLIRSLMLILAAVLITVCFVALSEAEAATWVSYSDQDCEVECNNFDSSSLSTVFMKGTSYDPNKQYKVAYYDGDCKLVECTLWSANDEGELESQCIFTDHQNAKEGTWYTVVFKTCKHKKHNNVSSTNQKTISAPPYFSREKAEKLKKELKHPKKSKKKKDIEDYIVAIDSFNVTQAAIPEFSSVIGAFGVGGFCGVTYFMFRRKRCLCGAA